MAVPAYQGEANSICQSHGLYKSQGGGVNAPPRPPPPQVQPCNDIHELEGSVCSLYTTAMAIHCVCNGYSLCVYAKPQSCQRVSKPCKL